MDDFMLCPPCSQCTEQAEYHSNHALKLQILDLFAALLLEKHDNASMGQSSSILNGSQNKLSHTVVEAFESVLVEVQAAAQKLFEQLLSGTSSFYTVSVLVTTARTF
jgi:midasin